jgi:hypothetical protein
VRRRDLFSSAQKAGSYVAKAVTEFATASFGRLAIPLFRGIHIFAPGSLDQIAFSASRSVEHMQPSGFLVVIMIGMNN